MSELTHAITQNSKYVLSAGFGTILGLLVMLILIWYSSVAETQQKVDAIVNVLNEKTNLLANMRDIARTRVLSIHRLRLLKDPFEIDQETQKFSHLANEFVATRLEFIKLPMNKTEKELWEKITILIKIGQDAQKNALQLVVKKKYSDVDQILFDYVIPAQNNVIKLLTTFLNLQRDASKSAVDIVTKSHKKTLFITTILGTIVTLIGILIATLSIRRTSHAEIVLVRASRAAHESNRLKSEFLAKMSHELRTPLNAIIGYSEVLEEDVVEAGDEGYVDDLKKIQLSGHNLLGLINNVLDISKIEAGKLTLHPLEFSIREMLNEAISTITPSVEVNNNRIKVHCDDDLGIMYADELRVRQSLLNLLRNACKFSKNGVITLEANNKTETDNRKFVYIKVTDTGIGIEHEQLKKLFEPFVQVDSSINRRYGGAGLGLVLAKRFCQLMGGDLVARSQKGAGSTFTIKLPINHPPEEQN